MPTFFSNRTSVKGSPAGIRLVDISDRPVEAEVLRDGAKVARVDIREDLVADFIAADRLDGRALQQRVIFQSVSAGARVPRGTEVDVVLSSPYLIGTDFVAGSHIDLSEVTIGLVAESYLANPEIRRAVQLADTPDDLAPSVVQALEGFAQDNNVRIDSADPERDFQAFYTAVKAADAFN